MPPDWLDLEAGETIRKRFFPSRWLMVKEIALFVVPSVATIALHLSGVLPNRAIAGFGLETLILVVIPLAAIPLVGEWIRRRFVLYYITDEQVWKKTGYLDRSIDPVDLDEIIGIDVDQSTLGRIMGKGTITIEVRGPESRNMRMENAPKPTEVVAEIRRAKDGDTET